MLTPSLHHIAENKKTQIFTLMKLRMIENNDNDDDKSKTKTIFNILWHKFLILMVIVIGLILFYFYNVNSFFNNER